MSEELKPLPESAQEPQKKWETLTAEDIAACIRTACAQAGLSVAVRVLSADKRPVVRILDTKSDRELFSIYPTGVYGNDSPLLVRLRGGVPIPECLSVFPTNCNFSDKTPERPDFATEKVSPAKPPGVQRKIVDQPLRRLNRAFIIAIVAYVLTGLTAAAVAGVLMKGGCHPEETGEEYDAWNEAYLRALK